MESTSIYTFKMKTFKKRNIEIRSKILKSKIATSISIKWNTGDKEVFYFYLTLSNFLKRLCKVNFALLNDSYMLPDISEEKMRTWWTSLRKPGKEEGTGGREPVKGSLQGLHPHPSHPINVLNQHVKCQAQITENHGLWAGQSYGHKLLVLSELPRTTKLRSSSRQTFPRREVEEAPHTKGSAWYGLSISGGNAVMPWIDHSALSVLEHLTLTGRLRTSLLKARPSFLVHLNLFIASMKERFRYCLGLLIMKGQVVTGL